MASWTDAETRRIEAIEELINQLQIVVKNLVTKEQFRQLLLIRQSEIEELQRTVASLTTQISVLQDQIT